MQERRLVKQMINQLESFSLHDRWVRAHTKQLAEQWEETPATSLLVTTEMRVGMGI